LGVSKIKNPSLTPVLLILLLAVGCVGRPHPPPEVQVHPVAGGHSETGVASWYGRKYHGRATASGERYDMHRLTAAHPTLPFGTRVRVTNLENGREVEVRINDRGPFRKGRILDLSYAAAQELRMVEQGVARVRIVVLELG
jgi:rare lipoprotein A